MSNLETLELAGVPLLLRSPTNRDRPAPLILFWHGFGSPNSEADIAEAFPLEQVEAWKAYLGLPLFGRRSPGMEEIMHRQFEDYMLKLLLPIIEQAMQEFQHLRHAIDLAANASPKQQTDIAAMERVVTDWFNQYLQPD